MKIKSLIASHSAQKARHWQLNEWETPLGYTFTHYWPKLWINFATNVIKWPFERKTKSQIPRFSLSEIWEKSNPDPVKQANPNKLFFFFGGMPAERRTLGITYFYASFSEPTPYTTRASIAKELTKKFGHVAHIFALSAETSLWSEWNNRDQAWVEQTKDFAPPTR